MADKTINELTAATTMGNDDLLVLQQGGTAKKLSGKQLGDYVYNAAAEKVAEVNKAVDDARSSINDIVESVQSMTELGTDTTLTTTGMAADAKAAGDKIKAVETAAMADLSQGTASGSIVTITDGADNIPIKKMTVDIEPIQDLHGYDHPWPAGGGANVWDEEWEIGGISSSTGGNIDQTDRIRSKNYIKVTPLESYYLANNIAKNIIANWYDSSKAFISGGASLGTVSYAFTIPENAEYMRIVIGSTTTYSGGLAINYPSSVTTYAPYSNICPITGWTGAKVTRTGKNFFDPKWLLEASGWTESGGRYTGNSGQLGTKYSETRGGFPITFKENTQYTISFNSFIEEGTSGNARFEIVYTNTSYSHTQSVIQVDGSRRTITSRAGATIDQIFFTYGAGRTVTLWDVCINEGTDGTYDPFGGTYDITFPSEADTVYGGKLGINEDGSGMLVVNRAAVTLSSITWAKYSNSIFVHNNFVSQYRTKQSTTNTLDSAFAYSKQMRSPADLSNGKFRIFGDGGLYIRDDAYTTPNQFQAGVQGIFIYELSTPLIYSITATQAKTLLGLNNIWADTGDISEFVYRKAPVDSSDIDAKIAEADETTRAAIESMIAGRETAMTATRNYAFGSLVIVNDILYKLDANVASGETIIPDSNCHITTVDAELAECVPNYRTVNGKALFSDVTLTAEDIAYDDSLSDHTSSSVGEAVSGLKSAIKYATGNEAIAIAVKNKYLKIVNNVIDVNNPQTSSSGYGYVIVPCSEGDVFIVSGVSMNAEPMAWAFTDSSYTILSKANANVTVTNAKIVAPNNTSYLVIHDKSPYRLSYKGIALQVTVDNNKSAITNYDDLKKNNIVAPTLFQDVVKKPLGEKYWENYNYTNVEARAVTTIDRTNKEHTFYNPVSCKVTKNDTAISDVRMYVPTGSEISLAGISAIRLSIYLEDASLFSQIGLEIIGTSWSRVFPISDKKNGWNIFTVYTTDGNISTWEASRSFRLYTAGQANRVFYLDALQFLRRPKGLVIFIDDGGYKTFLNNGYPMLKEMNVPVTWAIDTGRIGESHLLSENDVETLALDGNSEFSFHGHSGNPTKTMSSAELRDDCVSALHYLKKNGLLPKHFWRAAFVQNDAPNYMDVVNIVPVLATGTSNSSPTVFPFPNPYNIPRVALHNQTAPFTTIFDRLQKTHCLYVIYTHGIDSTGDYNTTPENWNSFVSNLQTAINDGYVECTTYDRLMTSEDY